MRMLAKILEWEDRLARNMVPSSVLASTLHAILSDVVDKTVDAGATLAAGRVKREQIFPLLDMIATMHDPYVLPSMKKAFRAQTMAKLKDKFLALLSQLCDACENCMQVHAPSLLSRCCASLCKDLLFVHGLSIAATQSTLQQLPIKVGPAVCIVEAVCHCVFASS